MTIGRWSLLLFFLARSEGNESQQEERKYPVLSHTIIFYLMIDFYVAKVGRMQKWAVAVRLKELLFWGSNGSIQ